MDESFTPDEELVFLFLKRHPKSTASEIATHTGLKHKGILARALEGLNTKGLLRHTDDRDERYYVIHTGHDERNDHGT
jgi:DNA-binding MarR family transcriptional regulator